MEIYQVIAIYNEWNFEKKVKKCIKGYRRLDEYLDLKNIYFKIIFHLINARLR